MKTKARESGMSREHELSSLFHRVSPGKWMALYLIARATSFATGCSDSHPAGSLGAKCITSCNEGHCDDGLVCQPADDDPDDAVCGAPTPDLPSSTGGDMGNVDDDNCGGPEISPLCPAGVPAYECAKPLSTLGPCTYASSTSYSTTYCCQYGPRAVDASADATDAFDANDATKDAASDVDDADRDAGDE
jgi:hypothetical protein